MDMLRMSDGGKLPAFHGHPSEEPDFYKDLEALRANLVPDMSFPTSSYVTTFLIPTTFMSSSRLASTMHSLSLAQSSAQLGIH
jgi:hypothetical protein